MKPSLSLVLVSAVVGLTAMGPGFADPATAVALEGTPAETGLKKSGVMSKADTTLARVATQYRSHVANRRQRAFIPSGAMVQATSTGLLVDARAAGSADQLLLDLKRLGLSRYAAYGNVVSGVLPFAAIDSALNLDSLRSMSASPPAIANAGSITSQGDSALRAQIARSSFAVDGSGVTVGVISDSFDTLGGADADILSGDLPAGGVPVINGESALCGTLVFCVDEGRAMLQIIHDMAPGADLLFQPGIDGLAVYASAIENLAASGARVIVDDLLLINEPMFQDGLIAQAIDNAASNGVVYFSAAGNSGRQSYEAPFDDTGEVFCIEFFEPIGDCDPIYERVGTMHDFDPGPGVDTTLSITVPVNGVMTVAMQWDQPFGGAGPVTDHDILILNEAGDIYREISANDNLTIGEPWEALRLDNNEVLDYGSEFSIMITYDDVDSTGPPATMLKVVIFGEDITLNEYTTSSGALFGHANAKGATAVGAAFFMNTPENGVSPPVLQPYSSAGGTPVLFDYAGLPLAEPEVRQAPEIVAVDGINTTFFFDDRYGDDGIDDFFGTSAAAPHAAGVAALLMQAKQGISSGQVIRSLQNTAVDMGPSGVDFDSGYGLIQTDAAIAAALQSYPHDLDGNGQADIFLRNAVTGQNRVYLMNGADIAANVAVNVVAGPDWEIVGNGDYDGDTKADVLWRNAATGQNWMYLMDGPGIASSVSVNTVPSPWLVAASDDFDGDGSSDILWRNTATGQNWLYLMDGATISESLAVNKVADSSWIVVGAGDFNRDQRADILWRNVATGQNWIYLMDGATIGESVAVNNVPADWSVAGVADFDGDSAADILWRHSTTGQNWLYLMDGAVIAESLPVNTVAPGDWNIAGTGDYNGDTRADILWRNSASGQVWIYLMSGASITMSAGVGILQPGWTIVYPE